jgi:hypothetical protein
VCYEKDAGDLMHTCMESVFGAFTANNNTQPNIITVHCRRPVLL